MYCTCRGGGRSTQGFTRQQDSDLWVCSRCLQPTRLVLESITDMLYPANATALLSVKGRADGIHECTFATPSGKKVCLFYHPYPRKVGMEQGRELLLATWQKLDEAFDGLMTAPGDPEKELCKVKCRTLAEVLAMFMQPFFSSADEIAREAAKRYKAREANQPHETPGLAEHIWNPNKNWDGSDRILPGASAPQPAVTLTAEQEAGIKNALASGAFSPEQLADMFKVPVESVRSLAG